MEIKKEALTRIANSAWLNDLIHWRNPVVSAVLLALVWVVAIMIKFYGFSFITLTGRAIQSLLLVGLILCILSKFKIEIISITFLNAKFTTRADLIYPVTDMIVSALDYLLPILFINSPLRSLRFIFILHIVSVLGKLQSGWTLFLTSVHIAMLAPLVYRLYSKQIDETLSKVSVQVNNVLSKASQRVPPIVFSLLDKIKNKIE
jgi:hypothetical protein